MEADKKIKSMVITAAFAAITFLGIQIFRIPMPAAVGTPFVHFGHIFVVMGTLLMGPKRGAVAGTLGLILFDLLNGFTQDIPQVFLETIIKCLIIGALMVHLKAKSAGSLKKEHRQAVICAVLYGIMNILIEFIMGVVKLMILGSAFNASVTASLTSLPATVINAVFMIIIVTLIYPILRKLFTRF